MRLTSPRVPEKVVQYQVVTLLRSIGGHVWVLGTVRPRGDSKGTRQTPGIPDIYAILPRPSLRPSSQFLTPIWVEVKAEGGRLRPEQAAFKELCYRAGTPHIVGGVDQVIAFLIEGGWLKHDQVPYYRLPKGPTHAEATQGPESHHVPADPAQR